MSKKINWTQKEKNFKKVIEHLQDCPVGYKLQNSLSLSLVDMTPPSSVLSSASFATDSNNTVCVGPANGNFMLNPENVKGELTGEDVTCPWGQAYINGTYDKKGNFDGTVICVYTRPATQDA
jgi:hypothetical protein